jgi:hypothetical protein
MGPNTPAPARGGPSLVSGVESVRYAGERSREAVSRAWLIVQALGGALPNEARGQGGPSADGVVHALDEAAGEVRRNLEELHTALNVITDLISA